MQIKSVTQGHHKSLIFKCPKHLNKSDVIPETTKGVENFKLTRVFIYSLTECKAISMTNGSVVVNINLKFKIGAKTVDATKIIKKLYNILSNVKVAGITIVLEDPIKVDTSQCTTAAAVDCSSCPSVTTIQATAQVWNPHLHVHTPSRIQD